MAKDLMDWAPKEAPAASEDAGDGEPEKPDLGMRKLQRLAELTGVEDPEMLVKLVLAAHEYCTSEGDDTSEKG